MKFYLITLLFFSHLSLAYEQCTDVKISEVLAGPQYNTMLRIANAECGNSGWICIHPENGLDAGISERVFSLALAAKATGSSVSVRWETDKVGCNGAYPMIFDIRMN